MIAIYATALAFIGITIYCIFNGYDVLCFLFSLLISVLVFLTALIFLVVPGSSIFLPDSPSEGQVNTVKETELIALQDNLTINGAAFLFSGYIDEELQYLYLYDNGYGMQYNNIKAKNCYIKYTNDTPRVVEWTLSNNNNVINHLFCPQKTYYTFYVPEGSVIENTYSIDLE